MAVSNSSCPSHMRCVNLMSNAFCGYPECFLYCFNQAERSSQHTALLVDSVKTESAVRLKHLSEMLPHVNEPCPPCFVKGQNCTARESAGKCKALFADFVIVD